MIGETQTDQITEPADSFPIKDLETLKVLSDPLRIRILEILLDGPRTVKQIAQELGSTPTKLYYHMNLLEEHGLIRVVATRIVSGIIEKQYHVSAYSYPVDRHILSGGGAEAEEGLADLVASTLDSVGNDVRRSVKAGLIDPSRFDPESRSFITLRTFSRLNRKQAHEFVTRFEALMQEFNNCQATAEDDAGSRVYGLMVALYPSTLRSLPNKPNAKEEEDA